MSTGVDEQPIEQERGRRRRREHAPSPVVLVAVVVVAAVIGGAVGLLISTMTTKSYLSSSVIRVYNPLRISGTQFGTVDVDTLTALERQTASSDAAEAASTARLERAGVDYDSVDWTAQAQSATLTVRCEAPTATEATRCARVFAHDYVVSRRANVAQPLTAQQAGLERSIARLTRQSESIQTRLLSASSKTGPVTPAAQNLLADRTTVLNQISQLQTQQGTLSQQVTALRQNFEVVVEAQKPDAPSSPATRRNLAVGVVVGLLLGVAIAVAVSGRASVDPRRD